MAKVNLPAVTSVRGPDGRSVIFDQVPGLTHKERADSCGTQVHSLQVLESLLVSGQLNIKEMIDVAKELAKYQFKTANIRRQVLKQTAGEIVSEAMDNDVEDVEDGRYTI